MGFTGDKTENSSQSKLELKVSKTINRKNTSTRRYIKRSISSITQIAHRPWTRSLTKHMENFSFCSIPLKKTDKNIGFKSSKHRNERNKENIGMPVNKEVKSQESMVVLYNSTRQNKFSSQDELPHDLLDLKLDPLTPPGEFILDESTVKRDLNEEDQKIIEQSLNLIDELGYSQKVSSGDITGDMKIESFVDLYHIDKKEINNNLQNMDRKMQ